LKDSPGEVTDKGKLIFLDTVGALLAASSREFDAGRIMADLVSHLSDKGSSTIIGYGLKTSAPNAALANGMMGYYCDIEAHHPGAILHPAAVLVPTCLAVAEQQGSSGREVLEAFIIGTEVELRLSNALSPKGMYARGFHPSSVCGSFGSAAASAKLLDLNGQQTANAIGLAGCQASGLLAWESDPTEMSRPFQIGAAARNGVTSALLSAMGFGGPEVLDGKYSVFKAFSGEQNTKAITEKFGRPWGITELAIKNYSCCSFLHPGVDGLLSLMAKNEIEAGDIVELRLLFPRSGAGLIDGSSTRSHRAQYILPIAAFRGEIVVDDILADQSADPQIRRLMDHVRVIGDDELDKAFPDRYSTRILLETSDGRMHSETVHYARGTPENPMTVEEVKAKFLRLARTVATIEKAAGIAEACLELDSLDDIAQLMSMLGSHQNLEP